ncbi:MAG: PilZ domain-containing protein [Deltaproteobacteria bacterium]|nr:PilZ domain-containing protein [Deltaproteobacteria bacterium]
MEAASERRDPQTTRVPLDDVLVDLYPEGLDESFPADAIDVGLGGLAMRSAVLPDVGSKLRCRFRSPEDGGSVAADAEVVWAEDSGPNHGQFGLRFTELEQADAERIAGLIDAWHESIGALSIANDIVDDSIDMDRRVSLRIDGVGPTVETELVHADGAAMIVEQPLPFLTIGKGVESDGRRGMLEAVDLRMDGGVPRLTLTVLFDRATGTATDAGVAPKALPETLDEESSVAEMAPAAMKAPLEMPVQAREIDARSGVGIDAPAMDESDDDDEYEYEDESGVEADAFDDEDESELDGEQSAEIQAAPEAEAKADPLLAELRSDPRAVATKAIRRVLPLWVKVRAWLRVAWAKTGPWLKIAAARTRGFAARCWTTLRNLRGKSTQKRTQRRPQQRQRQTRAPRQQARPGQRAQARGESKGAGRLRVGRLVLVVALLGGAVALTGYAMADGGPVLTLEKAPIEEPEPAYEAPIEEPMMDPELGDDPTLEAEAEPEGGQLDAPSFPSMPSVASGGSESLAFGEAHVAGGREFRLRLSVPPTALRGEPMDSGFKVTLEGANAIDGARRIGATHPRVARASILNQGERAVLEIRFAAGANPAYRVEARGDALLVTIGR